MVMVTGWDGMGWDGDGMGWDDGHNDSTSSDGTVMICVDDDDEDVSMMMRMCR